MEFEIRVSEEAERDLGDIFNYISVNDSPEVALKALQSIGNVIKSLDILLYRGHVPAECLIFGITSYREVFYKPYRIFYQVLNAQVQILLITDGRRDIEQLVQKRFLDSLDNV